MPAVIVMDLAVSSPAQQSHCGSLQRLGHNGDISGQATHHQWLCSRVTHMGRPNPPRCDEEKWLREVKSHTRSHTAGWPSQTPAWVSTQVQRCSDLKLAGVHRAPAVCKGPGIVKFTAARYSPRQAQRSRKTAVRCDGDRWGLGRGQGVVRTRMRPKLTPRG